MRREFKVEANVGKPQVASRVAGHLRRRTAGDDEMEYNLQVEYLERRFRLTALRAERGELYHQRATRNISNETLQLLRPVFPRR